jgi:hypothetical protein
VLRTDTYGVEILPTPVPDHLDNDEDGPESREVSGSDCWRTRLGSPVRSVETFWEHFTIGPAYVRGIRVADSCAVDVPVALRLDLMAGAAWMVAGIPQAPQMREVLVPGDELMVVFTAQRMRQIGFPDSEFLTAS